jgi:hypothetical protein
MRALLAVLAPECIEVPLLRGAAPAHGLDRLALQGPIHPLMRAIVLRTPGSTPLTENTETHPPDVETIATGRAIRELRRLQRIYGTGRWRKRRGTSRVRLADGTIRRAEVH